MAGRRGRTQEGASASVYDGRPSILRVAVDQTSPDQSQHDEFGARAVDQTSHDELGARDPRGREPQRGQGRKAIDRVTPSPRFHPS